VTTEFIFIIIIITTLELQATVLCLLAFFSQRLCIMPVWSPFIKAQFQVTPDLQNEGFASAFISVTFTAMSLCCQNLTSFIICAGKQSSLTSCAAFRTQHLYSWTLYQNTSRLSLNTILLSI